MEQLYVLQLQKWCIKENEAERESRFRMIIRWDEEQSFGENAHLGK